MKFLVAMALVFVVSSTGEGIEESALKEADSNSDLLTAITALVKEHIDAKVGPINAKVGQNSVNFGKINAKVMTHEKRISAVEKDVHCNIGSFMVTGSAEGSGQSGFTETRAVHFSGFKSTPKFVASLYSFDRVQQINDDGKDPWWGIHLSFRASSASQASITVKGASAYVRSVGVSWVACRK